MKYIRSPINYTGNKYRLLKHIIPAFPKSINTFLDVFGGSGTVVLNVAANKKIYNELNDNIYGIVEQIKIKESDEIIDFIQNRVEEFSLSKGKNKLKLTSDEEIHEYNHFRNNYLIYRDYINSESSNKYLDFLTIHYFAFNNLIRTSKKNKYNTPAGTGSKHFIKERHGPLIEYACESFKNITIMNKDFRDIDYTLLGEGDFVYLDPPYLLSNADYNKFWGNEEEKSLYTICDKLTNAGVRWAMSNMLVNNDIEHTLLKEWCINNNYNIYYIDTKYSGWLPLKSNTYNNTKEVLITNYVIDESIS